MCPYMRPLIWCILLLSWKSPSSENQETDEVDFHLHGYQGIQNFKGYIPYKLYSALWGFIQFWTVNGGDLEEEAHSQSQMTRLEMIES